MSGEDSGYVAVALFADRDITLMLHNCDNPTALVRGAQVHALQTREVFTIGYRDWGDFTHDYLDCSHTLPDGSIAPMICCKISRNDNSFPTSQKDVMGRQMLEAARRKRLRYLEAS
jgi:hypothetical protein